MTKIALTAWFADDESSFVYIAHGINGNLTYEQYDIAQGWLYQIAQWASKNRGDTDDEQ